MSGPLAQYVIYHSPHEISYLLIYFHAGSVMHVCKVAKFLRDDVGHFLCFWSKRAHTVCSHGLCLDWLRQQRPPLIGCGKVSELKLDVWTVNWLYGWQVLLDKKRTRDPRRCSQFWAISWVRVERARPLRFSCSFLCVSSMIVPFFSDFAYSELQNYLVVANACCMVSIVLNHL